MFRRTLRIVLDSIFPPTVHGVILRDYTRERFAGHLKPVPIHECIALANYFSPAVQSAVAACKFEKSLHAATLLSVLLEAWLKANPIDGVTLLIPIPLSSEREKERGFNQVTRVLEYLPSIPSIKIERRLLRRLVHTSRQTSLGRYERLKNVKDAFIIDSLIAEYDWSKITRVIICDDVTTTGATLEAARVKIAPLLPLHINLQLIAWAH